MRKYIREGDVFPRGYGFAWWRHDARLAVCYPIPLNVLARGLRDLLLWVRHPRVWMRYENDLETAYTQGSRDGYEQGFQAASRRWEIIMRGEVA